jgi:hypothetical protein
LICNVPPLADSSTAPAALVIAFSVARISVPPSAFIVPEALSSVR